MGMDVFRFKVIDILPKEDALKYIEGEQLDFSIQVIEYKERNLTWLKAHNISDKHTVTINEFDWEAFFEKNPEYKDYIFEDYDLREETNPQWIQLKSPTDEIVFIDNGFIFKDVQYVCLKVKEIGYMRKPFRHYEKGNTVEGNNLVLTVTNFSDEGEKAYNVLKKIDTQETDNGNVFIYNKDQLSTLQKFSSEPEDFEKQLINDWKDVHFVLFNW